MKFNYLVVAKVSCSTKYEGAVSETRFKVILQIEAANAAAAVQKMRTHIQDMLDQESEESIYSMVDIFSIKAKRWFNHESS